MTFTADWFNATVCYLQLATSVIHYCSTMNELPVPSSYISHDSGLDRHTANTLHALLPSNGLQIRKRGEC